MTQDKDLKRLIRARMEKTGESYTAARAAFLKTDPLLARDPEETGREEPPSPEKARPYAAPPEEWASLAGTSDDAVEKKTGRTWAGWVEALDEAKAHEMSHADIARLARSLREEMGGWWAQTVAVGYERIRGLREARQRRDGSYEAGKSRTFPVAASTLFQMFHDAAFRQEWLPEGVAGIRTATEDRSIRFDWKDGTRVNVYLTSKGPSKTLASVQHVKLESQEEVDEAKAAWHERLDRLGEALT